MIPSDHCAAAILPNRMLWTSGLTSPIAARVLIAGDFLPSQRLTFSPGETWVTTASRLAPYFRDASLVFANLESVLDADAAPPLQPRRLNGLGAINSAPASALDYFDSLAAPGTTFVLSLANNHAYDFGPAGVERTLQALKQRDFTPLGVASSLCSQPSIFVWPGPGEVRVGLWAAALASWDLATPRRPGVEPASRLRAREAISILRSAGAKFCVALIHAGCSGASHPDPADAAVMNSIAEVGFNVVAACHSHRIAGARTLNAAGDSAKFCLYGLGSIISDCLAEPLDREGLVAVAALDHFGQLVSIEIRPVQLGESGFGEIPSAEDAARILDRFDSLSQELADGSAARLFYRDLSPGLVTLYLRDVGAAFRHSGLAGLARKARRVRMRHARRLFHRVVG